MSDSRTGADSRMSTTIDVTVPHPARVYDYLLGGRDHYPPDRTLGAAIIADVPDVQVAARANRAFLGRAVRCLVSEWGITQFLDIGTGIPTAGNTHEVAQALDPAARVVYVDHDPIVMVHARALLKGTPQGRTAFIHADLRDPESILTDPAFTANLDPARPVAIMLVAIMMYILDTDGPQAIVARLLDAVPAGSCVVITHLTGDANLRGVLRIVELGRRSGLEQCARNRAEFESLFAGTELVAPGIAPVSAWRSDLAGTTEVDRAGAADSALLWAGVGRKC
ncbi:SAM-dependent methyltransferase [Nocardia sp. BMG111209]|uniref:SAM-dependent methyltransferase n=1 Tax=Nocardia sp. BMG111209 TaxID=1160137 RepID=UPI0003AA9AEE|nr:SAM-dependent methyltransferase [Nocardia sp. BMG111209]